jgi:type I restriction enzyme S subunit
MTVTKQPAQAWQGTVAGEVGRFRGGSGFPVQQQGKSEGDYPFYKVSDMNNVGNDTFMLDANNWITEPVRKTLGATAFPAGTIVFAKVGAAVFLERKKILSRPSCIDNNLAGFVLDSSRADVRFIHYQLLNTKLSDLVATIALPSLNGSTLAGIPIALPPLPEQRAIAAALSDVDALIAALDQLIAKKRDLKTATMQELLTGQRRLPGFTGAWEKRELGEVFTITAGRSKSEFIKDGGRFWVVDMGSVSTTGHLVVSKATDFDGDFLRAGDLVMPKDDIGGGNIIGRTAYIGEDGKYVLGDHVYCLRARAGDARFLSYVINTHQVNRALRSKVIGSAQLGIGRKSVATQVVPFPPVAEQREIAAVLVDFDGELVALAARRDKMQQLKQGMMQELLTGRTRLV